jgi:hypothetical protein
MRASTPSGLQGLAFRVNQHQRRRPGLYRDRFAPRPRSLVSIPERFHWTSFDLNDLLPSGWQHDVLTVANDADFRSFPRTPILSRESAQVSHIARGRVHADDVRRHLPWLQRLYLGTALELAAQACNEAVAPARDHRYSVVLNVQRGTSMRFECHVDSNPLTGLLFCTDHRAGGELAIGHNPLACDMQAIERDRTVIRPHAGHMVFFDGRAHPHYARPLLIEADVRVVAVMNFYTASCPESTRPQALNRHLYGEAPIARRSATAGRTPLLELAARTPVQVHAAHSARADVCEFRRVGTH